MKAKLIKTGNDYLLKEYGYGETLAITSGTMEGRKLSLKNCEAIANGYDLDELANKEYLDGYDTTNLCRLAFKDGFQKALDLMSDKKFSINEVVELTKILISNPFKKCGKTYQELTDSYIQSLQQTEWDVIVEMKKVKDETKIIGSVKGVKGSGHKITTYKSVPQLDATGCLILKLTQ